MEHIAAVLLLIGCSGDYSDCRELPAPVPLFEVAEDCDREMPFTISSAVGQAQKIVAKCIAVDPALEEEDAEIVWDVSPDGTLDASIEVPAVTVASNSVRNNTKGTSQE